MPLPSGYHALETHAVSMPDSLERNPMSSKSPVDSDRGTVWGTGVWGTGSAGLALPTVFYAGQGATYRIPGLDGGLDNRFMVFNASGERVFLQRGYQNGWDGTDRHGKPLPPGRYFLMVEVAGLGDDVQAYVELKR